MIGSDMLSYMMVEHASSSMGNVGQGLASPTQPVESKEDKNFDCSNTLPNVATDAFIKGASNELESGSDDADEVLAWRVGILEKLRKSNTRYECVICSRKFKRPEYYGYGTFVAHFRYQHADPAEWMDIMERV